MSESDHPRRRRPAARAEPPRDAALEALVAAYLLDLLDPAERADAVRLIAAELRAAALAERLRAELAAMGTDAAPRPGLWRRIAARLRRLR